MVKICIRKINLYFHLDTSLFFVVGVGCKCLLCYETPDTTTFAVVLTLIHLSTGWPGCLVLKQGAVNQLFLGVFLMFLACLDHAWWAQFHLGILGPQE